MRDLMTGLARPMLRLLGRDDRGAVGVLVAILVGGGVLVGMGALVVDVGQIYQNRAELQNGADAGALAVAKSCALGSCDASLATSQAVGNASALTGHQAGVQTVCGSGTLGACDFTATGGLTDCPPNPTSGANYVDVRTETKTPTGSLLPPVFARALIGGQNYDGTTVYACAQAEWGSPSSDTTIAVTISACEWATATNNGQSFAPAPPYPPDPAQSYDQRLTLSSGNVTSGVCPANPAYADAPGAFGWTQDISGTCNLLINGSTYGTNTGVSAGTTCDSALQTAWTNQTIVYVPVYSSVVLQGNNTVYTLDGFAGFVITGYRVPGQKGFASEPDWLNPSLLCSPPTTCIDGVFTQGLIPASSLPQGSGNNLGAEFIRLTG